MSARSTLYSRARRLTAGVMRPSYVSTADAPLPLPDGATAVFSAVATAAGGAGILSAVGRSSDPPGPLPAPYGPAGDGAVGAGLFSGSAFSSAVASAVSAGLGAAAAGWAASPS